MTLKHHNAAGAAIESTEESFMHVKPDDPNCIESYLTDLACRLLLAHNELTSPSALELIRTHMTADFDFHDTSVHENPIAHSDNLETHIANSLTFLKEHPTFVIKPYNPTAQVDKDGWHAVVWVTERGVGSEEDRRYNRESVSRMFFKRDEEGGRWMWYKHMSLRGGGDFL